MRGGHGPVTTVGIPLGWWIVGGILAAIWRFFAGQVVMRKPSRYDARYTRWAPPIPADLEDSRARDLPRSTWARRPGCQRQLVRLAVLAAVIGYFRAPVLTALLVGLVLLAAAVRGTWRWWQRSYYERVCGPFLSWLARRLEWEGVCEDPRKWIELPPHKVTWVPFEPIRAALVCTGTEDSEGDGWLARRWPKLATKLAPLNTPIAEQGWVRALCDPPTGCPPMLAVALRAAGRRIIALVERSRAVRVRPRLVRPDLTNPDAEVVVHYPSSYQAHQSNVGEVGTVLAERLPGTAEDWQLNRNGQEMTMTLSHPQRLPRGVKWDRDTFKRSNLLEAPIGEMAGGKLIKIDYKHATPHVNASGVTGTGKTVTYLVILGNFLYHGGHAVVVDPKRIDFVRPLRALRNVDLITVEDQFPKVLERVVTEMERRYQIIEQCALRADELGLSDMTTNAEQYFQPIQFAIDEKSRFTAKCKAWWKREGGGFNEETRKPIPGKGDPITIEWERDIVARGRAAAIYGMSAAQRNSIPNTFPDTDIRGNYQYKILTGAADGPAWVVTFPGQRYRKLSSQVKGRAIVGVGSELHEVQLAYMDWQEVRAAAQHGEQIMDAENQKRAELLAQVTGRPIWEVSPLPFWVSPPAETVEHVPGPDTSPDAAETPVLRALPPAEATDVSGSVTTDTEPIQGRTDGATELCDEPAEGSATGPVEQPDEPVANPFAGPSVTRDEVRGNQGAADHLGVDRETFKKALQRARSRGEEIPGVRTENRVNYYETTALAEWWNQRPGTGRKAS